MPDRMIRESIRTSTKINSLSDFEFRLWTYLLTYVDDYGIGKAEPALIKGMVLPLRENVTKSDIKNALQKMADTGMIDLYKVDGDSYVCFPNWGTYQRIQTKRSKYPSINEATERYVPGKSTVNHGDSRWITVSHGGSRWNTVSHGNPPLETKPNRNQIENKKKPNQGENPAEGVLEMDENGNGIVFDDRSMKIDPSPFELFWSLYPKHTKKNAAMGAFTNALIGTDGNADVIINGLKRVIDLQWSHWPADRQRFIPDAVNWLKDGCWTDEIEPEKESAITGGLPF